MDLQPSNLTLNEGENICWASHELTWYNGGNPQKQRIKSLYDNKPKNQLNVFTAIMSNWSQAEKFMKEYENGDTFGASMKEKQHSPYVQKCAQDTKLKAGNP